MEYVQHAIKYSYKILQRGRGYLNIPVGRPAAVHFEPGLEKLRTKAGAFAAAPSADYGACWIRDQLYCTLSYFYTGNTQKFKEGVWVVFDILGKHRGKIENVICEPPKEGHEFIHAKFDFNTYHEITDDWGHHQLDAIGLFLHIVAFSNAKGISLIRSEDDKRMIQLLVSYLTSVRYWEFSDHGMWEEGIDLHASSIGAVVAGLTGIEEQKLAIVPSELVLRGQETLNWLLPNESPGRDTDMALLSLVWPYNVVTPLIRDEIIKRVKEKLVQKNGVNRYLGDEYYRSDNGISGEWPMGFFWLSIAESLKGNKEQAKYWFERGEDTRTKEGYVPEIYLNGIPNDHTPLAWAHSMGIVAKEKLKNLLN